MHWSWWRPLRHGKQRMLGHIESRTPLGQGHSGAKWRSLDVLTQHMVSCALGGGFDADELRAEVERTFSYMALTDAEWTWCLDFRDERRCVALGVS